MEEIGIISVGTYEGLLTAHKIFKVTENSEEGNAGDYIARKLFQITPHDGSIRSITSCPSYITTGGYDGTIAMFDHRKLENIGSLNQHDDSIEALQYFESKYLVSASNDKTLCLWRTSDWALCKQFKGHTGGVTSLAIHPSGRLMLSAGRDGVIRMWDLMRAHNAKTRQIGITPSFLDFTVDGSKFLLGLKKVVTVNEAASEETVFAFEHPSEVTAHCIDGNNLWTGTASGSVFGYNLETGEEYGEYKITDRRVKGISVCKGYITVLTSEGDIIFGSVDSNNDIDTVLRWKIHSRITCGNFLPLVK